MSPKASGSSSERPITAASDGELTIFLFPDPGVVVRGLVARSIAHVDMDAFYGRGAAQSGAAGPAPRGRRRSQGGHGREMVTAANELCGPPVRHPLGPHDAVRSGGAQSEPSATRAQGVT